MINDEKKRFINGKNIRVHGFFKDWEKEETFEKKYKPFFIPKVDNSIDVDYF